MHAASEELAGDDVAYYQQPAGITEFYCIEFDKENSELERIVRIRPDGTIINDFRELAL